MAESTTPPPNGGATAATESLPRIVAQYARDLSFRNIRAMKGLTDNSQQQISVEVGVNSRKVDGENSYEVITKLHIINRATLSGAALFELEVEYVGVFEILALSGDRLEAYLLIECPRITFPFLRRIVSLVTQDAGFPPLLLDNIDFVSLYRKRLDRRTQAQSNGAGVDL